MEALNATADSPFAFFGKLPNMYFPIYFSEQTSGVPAKDLDQLKSQLYPILAVAKVAQWAGAAVGGVALLVVLLLVACRPLGPDGKRIGSRGSSTSSGAPIATGSSSSGGRKRSTSRGGFVGGDGTTALLGAADEAADVEAGSQHGYGDAAADIRSPATLGGRHGQL